MFNKNKTSNSKIRFQQQGFKKRLQEARNYKRPVKKFPQNKWEEIFNSVGLGSWKTKTLAVLILGLTVYVIYIPNFLYIKNVQVNGLNTEETAKVRSSINIYLDSKSLWPQKNLLLLSKSKLENYLKGTQTKILAIKTVRKKYPATLILNIEPRINSYLVSVPQGNFIVSNDGVVISQETPENGAATTTPILGPQLTAISIKNNPGLTLGDQFLNSNLLKFFTAVNQDLPLIIGVGIKNYELEAIDQPDINVFLTSNVKIIFDSKSDIGDVLGKLKLLISQLAQGSVDKLYYIDMRIKNKSYVCYKNTPCVKDLNINNQGIASSTEPSPFNQ